MAYFDNAHSPNDAYQHILSSVLEEKEDSRFQIICEGADYEYRGTNFCAYSIAVALLETKEFLVMNVSTSQSKWRWGNTHVNDYVNLSWSETPLKFLFHRRVAVPGNTNTPNVSKMSIAKNKDSAVSEGTGSANYKMLI